MFAAMLGRGVQAGAMPVKRRPRRGRLATTAKPKTSAETILAQHGGLVTTIARRFHRLHPTADLNDLLQEGRLGLLRAAEKYTKRPGASFTTYAAHHIKTRVKREAERSHGIRVPERKLRQFLKSGVTVPSVFSGEERVSHHEDAPTRLEAAASPTEGYGTIGHAHARATISRLRTRFTPEQWSVLQLRFERGLTVRETAKTLRKSPRQTYKIELAAKQRAAQIARRRS